ncbi:hypothetical protein BSL78_25450 [Apostichopus japonicus]|uniref:Band 7 domain-containing protein n=1 Tax=Stichopus japonicus TaxID=307972 RepID=A0A2G8JPV9_STIJA|nr:hypothetical protein BSL78_25450 [Apostichopus japonicus]
MEPKFHLPFCPNTSPVHIGPRIIASSGTPLLLGGELYSSTSHISSAGEKKQTTFCDFSLQVHVLVCKDVRLPMQLQRAMAAEAEAAREARAKVIAAEGEQNASRALKEAADVISQSPSALQLRYLQTLNMISAEKNSTIIFPLPIDLLNGFVNKK